MKIVFTILLASSLMNAQSFDAVIQRLHQIPEPQRQPLIERYLNTKGVSPIIEQDSIVHFVLYGIADSVFVTGNLQHWREPVRLEKLSCGQYSIFFTTFVVPSDARLDYQLIIDGKYKTDPQNPNITPSGYGPHSELRMPKFISSRFLQFRPDIAHGMIDSLGPIAQYPLPLRRYLPAHRALKVYVPPGYDTLSQLSVVYVHDGFEAISFAMLPTIIDNLIAENKIPPIIAVCIPPVEREDEYVGKKRDQFVKYVSDDVVPMIDALYRTDPSPMKRAMMGISNGGHISLYSVLSRPDVFLNAGGQSSTISPWLNDLTKKQFEANKISPLLKIYLDCGRYDIVGEDPWFGSFDFLDLNKKYSALLSSYHIPHYFKAVNDGHEWASWRQRMPDMLYYFFGKQQ